MTFSDTLLPGDKIDIHLVQQLAQETNKGILGAKLYKSVVTDNLSSLEIEIAMPMDGTKMVLFQSGLRLDLVFYTRKGLIHCHGTVKDRYKKGNLYLLVIEQRTKLQKFQRREFFRVSCIQEIRLYPIGEEVAALPTTEELCAKVLEPEYILALSYGQLVDISGGGMRFLSAIGFQEGDFVLTEFYLQNDKLDHSFCLVMQIVASEEKKDERERYISRAKFIYKDLADRELIVRFVFEEERRLRRVEGR